MQCKFSIRRRTHYKFLERSIWIQYTTRCFKIILTCCIYNARPWLSLKSFHSFVDVNECLSRETFTCHQRASCVNTNGFYFCVCHPGFNGDGKMICTGDDNFSLLRHKQKKSAQILLTFTWMQASAGCTRSLAILIWCIN